MQLLFSRSPDMDDVLKHVEVFSDKTELTVTVSRLRIVSSAATGITYLIDADAPEGSTQSAWFDATPMDGSGGWVIGGFESHDADGPFDVCDVQP